MLHGVIFDLDGTLIDSALDFDALRLDMQLPAGQPILEALTEMSPEEAAWRWPLLHAFELAGAEGAKPMPRAAWLVESLAARGVKLAVLTRNSGEMARVSLQHLPAAFDPVMSRDDGPVKPDPWAILHICERWGAAPQQVAMIGDYHFDIAAGNRAGTRTALITHGQPHERLLGDAVADYIAQQFDEAFLNWLLHGKASNGQPASGHLF